LDVFVVYFEEDEEHEVDEVIGDQVGVADVVDDAVEDDVPEFDHGVPEELDEELVALLADFVELLPVEHHAGEVDVDHPGHGDHEGVDDRDVDLLDAVGARQDELGADVPVVALVLVVEIAEDVVLRS